MSIRCILLLWLTIAPIFAVADDPARCIGIQERCMQSCPRGPASFQCINACGAAAQVCLATGSSGSAEDDDDDDRGNVGSMPAPRRPALVPEPSTTDRTGPGSPDRRSVVNHCVSVTEERDFRYKLPNQVFRWVFRNNCNAEIALSWFKYRGVYARDGYGVRLPSGNTTEHVVWAQDLPVNLEYVACPTPTTVNPRRDAAGNWYCLAH